MSHSNSSAWRVYILGDGSLFAECLAHMLISNSRLQVFSRDYMNDAPLLTDMKLHQPDVILLHESDRFGFERLLKLLPTISWSAELRVIVLRPDSTLIDIYDKPASQFGILTMPHRRVAVSTWKDIAALVGEKHYQI